MQVAGGVLVTVSASPRSSGSDPPSMPRAQSCAPPASSLRSADGFSSTAAEDFLQAVHCHKGEALPNEQCDALPNEEHDLGDGERPLAAATACRNRLDVPVAHREEPTAQRVHSAGDALSNDWADALPNERPTLSKLHGADEHFRAADGTAHACTVPPHVRPTALPLPGTESADDALANEQPDALSNERPPAGCTGHPPASVGDARARTTAPYVVPVASPMRDAAHAGRALHHEQADALANEQGAALANEQMRAADEPPGMLTALTRACLRATRMCRSQSRGCSGGRTAATIVGRAPCEALAPAIIPKAWRRVMRSTACSYHAPPGVAMPSSHELPQSQQRICACRRPGEPTGWRRLRRGGLLCSQRHGVAAHPILCARALLCGGYS